MSVNKQSCIFCPKKRDEKLAVYSLGLGRLGICIDCAIKAVKVLTEHDMTENLGATLHEIEGLLLHKHTFCLNDDDLQRLYLLQEQVSDYKKNAANKLIMQVFSDAC